MTIVDSAVEAARIRLRPILMTSFAFTSSFSARSETVIPSASVMVRVTGGGGVDDATGACGRGSRRGPDERGPDGRGGGGR